MSNIYSSRIRLSLRLLHSSLPRRRGCPRAADDPLCGRVSNTSHNSFESGSCIFENIITSGWKPMAESDVWKSVCVLVCVCTPAESVCVSVSSSVCTARAARTQLVLCAMSHLQAIRRPTLVEPMHLSAPERHTHTSGLPTRARASKRSLADSNKPLLCRSSLGVRSRPHPGRS